MNDTLESSTLVAQYYFSDVRSNGTVNDLDHRAWLAREDGSLTITSLLYSDQHCYICQFDGDIQGQVCLEVYGKFHCISSQIYRGLYFRFQLYHVSVLCVLSVP